MGIVKISDQMHESLRLASSALSRSINAQAEHWMRIGMLAELHPDLPHSEICQLLIRAERAGGFDLETVASCRQPRSVASGASASASAPGPSRAGPSRAGASMARATAAKVAR